MCWALPLAAYRILNTGTLAMLALGACMLMLPKLWTTALHAHPYLRRAIAWAGCAGLLFCLVISLLIARRAWFQAPDEPSGLPVIVLGSKINGDQPSLMLRRRLDIAAAYLARNPGTVCVVSGGQGADEAYPEAVVMQRYLLGLGIEEERVLVEPASTNTRQNLRYSRALLPEWDTAVIVTDSFHQLRASVFARAEGLYSYNLSSLTPWGLMPSYWLREILGVCWAWLSVTLRLA